MTRTEILQSLAFTTFFSLPNALKGAAMQHMIDESETMFDGWDPTAIEVQNNATDALAAGDIIVGAVTNSAPGGLAGSTQTLYIYREAP